MKFPITVVLDDIRSALNTGSVLRTSDAAGIEKVIMAGITPAGNHPRVIKTALNAQESVNWEYIKDSFKYLSELKSTHHIVSVEKTKNAIKYTDYNFNKPLIIVMGNEISGVSSNILQLSEAVVEVPMLGEKESLNVAVTYGIVVYEIIRQWS